MKVLHRHHAAYSSWDPAKVPSHRHRYHLALPSDWACLEAVSLLSFSEAFRCALRDFATDGARCFWLLVLEPREEDPAVGGPRRFCLLDSCEEISSSPLLSRFRLPFSLVPSSNVAFSLWSFSSERLLFLLGRSVEGPPCWLRVSEPCAIAFSPLSPSRSYGKVSSIPPCG